MPCDRSLDFLNIDSKCLRVYIDKYRFCTSESHRGCCSSESMSRHNYFIPWSDAERSQTQFQSRETVIHADGIFCSTIGGEFLLEFGYILSKDKITPVQNPLNSRANFRPQVAMLDT